MRDEREVKERERRNKRKRKVGVERVEEHVSRVYFRDFCCNYYFFYLLTIFYFFCHNVNHRKQIFYTSFVLIYKIPDTYILHFFGRLGNKT